MSSEHFPILSEAQLPDGCPVPDPFSTCSPIPKLTKETFIDYLKSKEIVLVMFYEPGDLNSFWSAKHFKIAANTSERPNSGFAVIDCLDQRELCRVNNALAVPTFTLYSGTNVIGNIRHSRTFDASMMRNFVDQMPVLEKPRGPQACPC